jgi:CDP-glycerol glycerophosphotransferase (TagB/SpsB family)
MVNLENKKCFIYPYSALSILLQKYLKDKNIEILGFVDSYNKEHFSLEDILNIDFDYVLIFSPNHLNSIYNFAKKSINKSKLLAVSIDEFSQYSFTNDIETMIKDIQNKKDTLIDIFNQNLDTNYILKDEILLIGIDFIDLNIKYLYLYLKKHSKYKIYLATTNKKDISMFKSYDIDVVDTKSKEFIKLVFQTKIKIIDHATVDDFLIKSLKIGKSIQLWHGITIESLGVNCDYKTILYDIVLSTSQFVTNYSFSKLFDSKKIVHCGYPRNDVINFDDITLININNKLLQDMKNDNFRYVIYMPTHRALGFEKNPINYQVLNQFGANNNIKFIIKMHPFVAQQIRDDLSFYQDQDIKFDNLIIHESNKDIYPLFRYSDMLISDYSSVYFDYLFASKPILFFPYDFEDWQKTENGTLLDYFTHSPGDKCYSFDELLDGVLKNLTKDNYKDKRKQLLDKMFENQTQKASALIECKMVKLLK